ncbi:MAG: PP2C family protein-serine/threonine phosphatase [Acidimicrobiales bacterium]
MATGETTGEGTERPDIALPRPRSYRLTRLSLLVLGIGLVITGALAWTASALNDRNENRLLGLQVREAATALGGILPSIEIPLASSVGIANATGGDASQFNNFMAAYVGPGRPFVSASLWQLTGGAPRVVSVVGPPPILTGVPAKINKLAAGAPSGGRLSVIGILSGGGRLGFADGPSGGPSGFVVFAESPIPAGHKVSLPKDFAFSQLNFALYLGGSQRRSALVEASVSTVPLTGRTAVATVPFGDTTLTLVGTAMGTLGGSLGQRLAWIVGVIGVVLSLAAALMTERLVRRRRLAESLAAENRRLYGEQHGIAEALQRALLPNELPALGGVEIDGRYVAGMESMNIGGDWYDVIAGDDDHFLFVVGDVSGRGVRAATIMASLHYSIRAYAAEGDPPSAILTKLCSLLDVDRDAHFATILVGYVDINRREVTLSSAGHFGPLLMSRDETDYVDVVTGVPIGIDTPPTYPTVTVTVPRHGTLLAFTDGLVERRGESLDVGLERLRDAAANGDGATLDSQLAGIISQLIPHGSDDDVAMLGIRWQN